MSNSRSKRRPGSNRSSNPNGNRGPGRGPVTAGTGSVAVPTALAQASVLGTWAANDPMQVEQGPWEPPSPELLDQDPDGQPQEPGEGPVFDPDLAFGLQEDPREDPLPAGARVSDGAESDSAARTKRGASTGSSRDDGGVPNPLAARGRARVFAKLAAAAFMAASGVLNERLALDDEDETWLADDDDVDAVSKPAGRLISRKLPLPEGTDTSDLADAIEIAIAGAGYLAKNVTQRVRLLREARRIRREGGGAVYQEA